MRRRSLIEAMLVVATIPTIIYDASAGSSSVGIAMTSDREPGRFSTPKDIKYEFKGTHMIDSGVIFGGSFTYTDTAFGNQTSQNLETTIGYRMPLANVFSVTGTAGIGEYWRQNSSAAFPYYVLRVEADLELSQDLTWNVISYRFRDAFDPRDDYNTPQIATGITFKFNRDSSVSAKIMRTWKDGIESSTGVLLGFRQGF